MIVVLLIIIALILACGVFGTDDVAEGLGTMFLIGGLLALVGGYVLLIYLNSRGHR